MNLTDLRVDHTRPHIDAEADVDPVERTLGRHDGAGPNEWLDSVAARDLRNLKRERAHHGVGNQPEPAVVCRRRIARTLEDIGSRLRSIGAERVRHGEAGFVGHRVRHRVEIERERLLAAVRCEHLVGLVPGIAGRHVEHNVLDLRAVGGGLGRDGEHAGSGGFIGELRGPLQARDVRLAQAHGTGRRRTAAPVGAEVRNHGDRVAGLDGVLAAAIRLNGVAIDGHADGERDRRGRKDRKTASSASAPTTSASPQSPRQDDHPGHRIKRFHYKNPLII
ncbi:hypothetical protein D3C86_1310070 [compost metagenome]